MKFLGKVTAAALATAMLASSPAHAVAVDLELVLLVDSSGSISGTDFDLQRDAYEAAFRSASIISAIESGAIGSIAATLVYFSGNTQQMQSVGWTQISDAASANAFADAIAAAARPFSGSTGIAAAFDFVSGLVSADNGFEGSRTVVDISGDGSESNACSFTDAVCAPLQTARDGLLAAGADTINALWIEDSPFFCEVGCDIDPIAYGLTNVLGGAMAFQDIAAGFAEFADAIDAKILREVIGMPEPGTVLLLGLGLVGFGLARRRRS